ncbi:acetyl-CoA carboxylase biotin carboxyl carrier protein [Lachnospiraceae bacterium KK002]
MEFDNLVKLIQTVSESELTRFSYEEKGIVISMKKEKQQTLVAVDAKAGGARAAEVPEAEAVSAGSRPSDISSEGNIVKSPLVGTFYSGPEPEAEPFVKVGDHVSRGQTLGIVEAMKLMNEIESDYEGVVKQILVSNEDVIEFGQPLFVIGR